MDIIYTGSRLPKALKGRGDTKAINPVHFTVPEADAKTVYLDGDFPKVALAYRALGIPVKPLSDLTAATGAAKKEA
jgi:hypothetical protein